MICYKDMTFCSAGDACTCPEWRKLTPAVREEARKIGLPISVGNMCYQVKVADVPKS